MSVNRNLLLAFSAVRPPGKKGIMYQAPLSTNTLRQEFTLKSENKPTTCPWCGSHRIAIVLGGMPVYIPEMERELDNGEAHIVDGSGSTSDPKWQCTECGAQFFRQLCSAHSDDDDQFGGKSF